MRTNQPDIKQLPKNIVAATDTSIIFQVTDYIKELEAFVIKGKDPDEQINAYLIRENLFAFTDHARTRVLMRSAFGAKFSNAYLDWLDGDYSPNFKETNFDWENFGKALKQIRVYGLNMTMTEMEERYDVNSAYISRLENNKHGKIPSELIIGLAKDGYSIDELMSSGFPNRSKTKELAIDPGGTQKEVVGKLSNLLLELPENIAMALLQMAHSYTQHNGKSPKAAIDSDRLVVYLEDIG